MTSCYVKEFDDKEKLIKKEFKELNSKLMQKIGLDEVLSSQARLYKSNVKAKMRYTYKKLPLFAQPQVNTKSKAFESISKE